MTGALSRDSLLCGLHNTGQVFYTGIKSYIVWLVWIFLFFLICIQDMLISFLGLDNATIDLQKRISMSDLVCLVYVNLFASHS